jgi:hypothetical protein
MTLSMETMEVNRFNHVKSTVEEGQSTIDNGLRVSF